MECPHPSKQPLSPEGEKRWRIAENIHAALWHCIFKGQNAIRAVAQERKGIVEYRLPHIAQILDFVNGYGILRKNEERCPGVEVIIPASKPHGEHYALRCIAPLPEQFAIEESGTDQKQKGV